MKSQILFSGKNKKNISKISSAEKFYPACLVLRKQKYSDKTEGWWENCTIYYQKVKAIYVMWICKLIWAFSVHNCIVFFFIICFCVGGWEAHISSNMHNCICGHVHPAKPIIKISGNSPNRVFAIAKDAKTLIRLVEHQSSPKSPLGEHIPCRLAPVSSD